MHVIQEDNRPLDAREQSRALEIASLTDRMTTGERRGVRFEVLAWMVAACVADIDRASQSPNPGQAGATLDMLLTYVRTRALQMIDPPAPAEAEPPRKPRVVVSGDWYLTTWKGADHWVALAKRAPFVNGHPLLEPGHVWFQIGASERDALDRIKAEVLQKPGTAS